MLKKTATITLKVPLILNRDFSVHHMTSLARHFSVLTHTLEPHTKHHVNISGSQKKIFRMFFEVLSPAYSNISGLKEKPITYMKQIGITATKFPEIDITM